MSWCLLLQPLIPLPVCPLLKDTPVLTLPPETLQPVELLPANSQQPELSPSGPFPPF